MGVWNAWGYGIAFLGGSGFEILETEIRQKLVSLRNLSGICLRTSAPEKHIQTLHSVRHQSIPAVSASRDMHRYRPKGVLGKVVGNNKTRQKCVKNAPKWVLFMGKDRERGNRALVIVL